MTITNTRIDGNIVDYYITSLLPLYSFKFIKGAPIKTAPRATARFARVSGPALYINMYNKLLYYRITPNLGVRDLFIP